MKMNGPLAAIFAIALFGCDMENGTQPCAIVGHAAVAWECQAGCDVPFVLAAYDRLSISDGDAVFSRSACGTTCTDTIRVVNTGTEGDCSTYAPPETEVQESSLGICAEGKILIGHMMHSSAAGDRYWVMYGVPLVELPATGESSLSQPQ